MKTRLTTKTPKMTMKMRSLLHVGLVLPYLQRPSVLSDADAS
jgi:hypothetical protein